jgi:hypothetical protein
MVIRATQDPVFREQGVRKDIYILKQLGIMHEDSAPIPHSNAVEPPHDLASSLGKDEYGCADTFVHQSRRLVSTLSVCQADISGCQEGSEEQSALETNDMIAACTFSESKQGSEDGS